MFTPTLNLCGQAEVEAHPGFCSILFCLQDRQLPRWIKGFLFLCELQCRFDHVIQGGIHLRAISKKHWVCMGDFFLPAYVGFIIV